ncbi:MAG TPA: hypothetical protein VD963_01170 [Phycisphaerales bacterium]|nr:hypothetical protein [Phycisphaerales bacterium]
MRWMWIDRVLELVPGRRLVAIKNIALAEGHLHDHFAADRARGLEALPVMPASLVIEGMAQSAGVLVGQATGFTRPVILAKITRAELGRDAGPGMTLRYTTTLERLDGSGAATAGTVDVLDHADPAAGFTPMGSVDLMFGVLEAGGPGNGGGGASNFVLSDLFRTLLRTSAIDLGTA